jgi:vancomycin resistance protein YoaR
MAETPTALVAPAARRQTSSSHSLLLTTILLLVVLLLAAALTPVAYGNIHAGHVFPGIYVLGFPLGGLTRDEARTVLSRPIADLEGQMLTLRYGDRTWSASAGELGLNYDLEATVDQAFAVGRSADAVADARQRFGLLVRTQNVDAVVGANPVSSLQYLQRLARDIDVTMQNASLALQSLQVVSTTARTGYRLDIDTSAQRIAQALSGGYGGDVQLAVTVQQPTITDQSIAEARTTIQTLIATPITVTFSGREWTLSNGAATARNVDHTWTIDRAQIAGAIVLEQRKNGDQVVVQARFDSTKFQSFFSATAKELNRPVQDARVGYDVQTSRLTPVQVSQDGRVVDVAENVKRLQTTAASDNHAMPLAVTISKPLLTADDISKLTVKDQVGQGLTTFAGSSEARAHNIRLAASRLDNAIIAPGATFSLLDRLGPITAEAGYQEGFAIVGDSTVTDVGGGVCQVATTAFRAAFYGGLPIVERNPHRYIVSRYFIIGGPHGLDAAIYDPGRDLKFKNTTGNYLVIKADAGDAGRFTVTLYGTNPGWTVSVAEPVIKPGKAPGPRMANLEDPTKPVGYLVMAQASIAGETVSISRTVRQGTNVILQDTLNTAYQSADEQWIIGTKK